jgi:hypothetical protein
MGARSSRNTTQNNRSDGHLLEYFRNTFVRGGGGTNAVPPPFTATGGTVTTYNGKTIHTFLAPGTFTVSGSPGTVEYVVVAGGGGGGVQHGGGGGAGGYLTSTTTVSSGTSPITVGAGGVGLPAQPSLSGQSASPGNGTSTVVSFPGGTITAGGGGGGGSLGPSSGSPAGTGASVPLGSGGGGALNQPGISFDNKGTGGPQGYPGGGGRTYSGSGIGGGGGGAGGAGFGNPGGSDPTWGIGGNGVRLPATFQDPSNILGTPGPAGAFYVAGGGGGASHFPWPFQNSGTYGAPGGFGGGGTGGSGGGGPGAYDAGTAGTTNTGGGGGSAGPNAISGANGGSGIVIIAYPS